MAAPQVGIVGVSALLRDLTKLGDPNVGDLAKAFSAAGKKAAEPVAALARSNLPKVDDTLSGDVRTSGTRTGATVRMGRASIPYAGWIEFGGARREPHYSYRTYDARGRYLFPAAGQLKSTAADLYSKAAQEALDAYNWTNQTGDGSGVHD